jgi:hypothetical protein
VESVEIVREPKRSPPQPAVNALALRQEAADPHAPTGFLYRAAKLGPLLDVRALFLSTTGLPANVCYPDTGHWLIRNGLGRDEVVVRETGPVAANTASSGVAGP